MKTQKKPSNRLVSYEDGLTERLKDPGYAAEYLNAHLDDPDDFDQEAFLLALRDVAVAYGVTRLSKKTKLGRESLYKTLSKKGNPKVSTLTQLLKSLGMKLSVETQHKKASGI